MSDDTQSQPDPISSDEELRDLLAKLADGDLSPELAERLCVRLRNEPAARAAYLQAMHFEALLHLEFPAKDKVVRFERGTDETANPRSHRASDKIIPGPWNRWISIAAAAVVVVALGLWWVLPNRQPVETNPALVTTVATLVDARECKWEGAHAPAVEDRLSQGVLELISGVALIEFDGGARLALQGPASLDVRSARSARLRHGTATVRCEMGLNGFSLLTPTSTVVDMGTEFGVSVGDDGVTAVEVLDGAVEVAGRSDEPQPTTRFLSAGETLQLGADGTDRVALKASNSWVRDYSSRAERSALAQPPRLFAHDSFHPETTPLRDYAGGQGWTGPWWKATREGRGEFHFAPLAPMKKLHVDLGQALTVGAGVEVRRRLSDVIDPRQPQRLYLSFSLMRLFEKLRDERGRLGEATVLLRASRDPASFIGMGLSGLNYWVTADPAGWERSETPASKSGPYLVVVRIDLQPVRGNEVAVVAFDTSTPLPEQEPQKWNLVTRRKMAGLEEPFDLVALRVRHPGAFKFGEINLGNSWQAVTRPASVK